MAKQFDKSESKFELKKKIGIWSCVGVLAGTMVGSGIFISPAGVIRSVDGNVGFTLILWALCGLVSLLAALCYAELGTKISESGADFAYLKVAYGKPFGFLYAWTAILVVRATGNAAGAYTFGLYMSGMLFEKGCSPPPMLIKFAGIFLILSITALNCYSVKASAKFQNFFTAAKFIAMISIIVGGVVALANGYPKGMTNFNTAFDADGIAGITFGHISMGFYQGLYSYAGWNNLNHVAEEIKDNHKNIPRGIIIAVSLVTAFYILMNVAYLSVLTPAEMVASPAVALSFAERVLGKFSWIVPLCVCLSTSGSLNGSYLTGGRMPFVAARAGQWPKIFEMVHVDYFTPMPSLVLNTAASLLFLIPGDFEILLSAFSFASWAFHGMSALAVIVLRYKRKDLPTPYKVPIVIPIIVTAFSAFVIVAPLVQSPNVACLYAFIFILSGWLYYYPFVHKKYSIPGSKSINTFAQLIFKSAPTDWESEFD